jgi:tetratricopeptide (TPR) repeat protein
LAQYYFNEKQFDKSLECVAEFDKLEQNSPLTYQMRALIFEEKGNDFEAHINWAKYNLCKNEKDVALNEYMSAYQVKSDDLELVQNIAELLEELGDKNHAAEFYEKTVELEPSNKKALQRLAEFYESIGDYRAQVSFLEKLYQLDNKNALVIKNLAKSYEKTKNKEKALEFYNKFIANSPVNEDYEQIKAKIKKLESTDFQEDDGLIEKFMRLFAKK